MNAGAVVNVLVLVCLASGFGLLLWRIYRRMRADATRPPNVPPQSGNGRDAGRDDDRNG